VPKQQTIVLVSAQLQSGKDTFGKPLARALDGITIAFADPLKEIAIQLGMPSEVAYGGEADRRAWKKFLKALGKEADAREWLQWLGTEFGRDQIGKDIWIQRLLERVQGRVQKFFVVTDARFKNELLGSIEELAKKMDMDVKFVRIRLKRPGAPGGETHKSETEQLEIPDSVFDEVVVNDGTAKDLEHKAKEIARKYKS
jgi:hypothetical protein